MLHLWTQMITYLGKIFSSFFFFFLFLFWAYSILLGIPLPSSLFHEKQGFNRKIRTYLERSVVILWGLIYWLYLALILVLLNCILSLTWHFNFPVFWCIYVWTVSFMILLILRLAKFSAVNFWHKLVPSLFSPPQISRIQVFLSKLHHRSCLYSSVFYSEIWTKSFSPYFFLFFFSWEGGV